MLIGYARVSSNDQDTAAQVAALKAAKCERIYGEQAFLAAAVRAVHVHVWWQSNGTRPLAPTTDVCVRQGSLRRSR
jgi:predicted site-specific integrase-resolvase